MHSRSTSGQNMVSTYAMSEGHGPLDASAVAPAFAPASAPASSPAPAPALALAPAPAPALALAPADGAGDDASTIAGFSFSHATTAIAPTTSSEGREFFKV